MGRYRIGGSLDLCFDLVKWVLRDCEVGVY